MSKTGYVNGSDMLLYFGGKAVGHCSTHRTSVNAETKDRAVKPAASEEITKALFKDKSVVGLSVSISADGLCFYQETENGYKTALTKIMAGDSVEVKCMERESETPYLTGKFVITKLERTDPAQDDSTYSIELENDGAVTVTESAITETAPTT